MKDWSTTKKILVVLGVLILVALIIAGLRQYNKSSQDAEIERAASRIGEVVKQKVAQEDVTGENLAASIRSNLAKQPISEIGFKFYQP